jgi:hypothetical protein
MYILKHTYNRTKRTFKTKKTLVQFLKRHKWNVTTIKFLVTQGVIFGWKLVTKE